MLCSFYLCFKVLFSIVILMDPRNSIYYRQLKLSIKVDFALKQRILFFLYFSITKYLIHCVFYLIFYIVSLHFLALSQI